MLSKKDQHKLNMEQIISELIQTDKQCKQALNELEKKKKTQIIIFLKNQKK